MEGFGLLMGHLIGDYIVQNDYLAANKTLRPSLPPKPVYPWKYGPAPADRPSWSVDADPADREAFAKALEERNAKMEAADRHETEVRRKLDEYNLAAMKWCADAAIVRADRYRGIVACTLHCLLYTLAVWLCSFWWMPWWGLLICFAAHWPIDRFRLARLWMVCISGQKVFATGPLSPWSIIVVDNVFHLLTLFLIGMAAKS